MRYLFGFICLSFLIISVGSIARAQTPTPTPPTGDEGPVKTFEVRLPVTVTEKKKKKNLVAGLSRGDFAVYEDGIEQEVTFFTDEKTNPPVYVGVLMDTSPSTAGKMRFSKEAAKNFIYTVTRLRKDKAAFMTFDHLVTLRQDFTDKLDLLDKSAREDDVLEKTWHKLRRL